MSKHPKHPPLLAILLFALVVGSGCSAWKESYYTPDSFNYTLSRDRFTGDQTDYFGLTWDLKPGK